MSIIGVGQIGLRDISDAIISGVMPASTEEGQLWIDTSGDTNVLKVYDNGSWIIQSLDVQQMDTGLKETIEKVTDTLGSITNDNKLNLQDRIVIVNDLSKVLGSIPSTSNIIVYPLQLPDAIDLEDSFGSYASVRKASISIGISSTEKQYIDLELAYTALKNYLETLPGSIRVWDVRNINKDIVLDIDGDAFRSLWLDYYNAELALQNKILSVPGPAGASSYTHIRFSDDNGVTFTAENGAYPGIYIGIYVDSIEEDSLDPSAYKWIKFTGNDARLLSINASSNMFTFDGDNNPLPSNQTITLEGILENVIGEITYTVIPYDENNNEVLPLTLQSTDNPNNKLLTLDIFSNYIKVVITGTYEDLHDTVSVYRIRDGKRAEPAISASLSNDYHIIPTDENGNNGDFSTAISTMTVFVGNDDNTSEWNISVNVPIEVSGSLTNNTYTVNAMSIDSANIEFVATKDGKTIKKVFTIGKNRQGITGKSPSLISLDNSLFNIVTLEDGSNGDYDDLITNVTIMTGDIDETSDWTITHNPSFGVTGTLTGNSFKLDDLTVDNGKVEFIATKDNVKLNTTLTLSKNKQAISNPIINLTNDYSLIVTDEFGENGIYEDAISTVQILRANNDETSEWTVTASPSFGITGSLTNKTYTVTNLSTDNGKVTLTATKGQLSLSKDFVLGKNKQGITGRDSVLVESDKEIIPIITDEYGFNGDFSDASVTITVIKGEDDVTNEWIINAYPSISISGILTDNTFKVNSLNSDTGSINFTATKGSITLNKVVNVSKSKQGISNIIAKLSDDFQNINTLEDGSGGDYTNVYSILTIEKGEDDVTDQYTITANASTGIQGVLEDNKYTLTDMTADSGSVTFTAIKDSKILSKTFYLNKIKEGKAAISAFLTNELFNINTLEDGTGGDYSLINTSLIIMKGEIEVTNNWDIDITVTEGISGTINGKNYKVNDLTTDNGIITFTATNGTEIIIKTCSIGKNRQAISTYAMSLSNENHTVVVLEDGTGGDYSGAKTDITILKGNSNDTSNWNITCIESEGLIGDFTNNTYSVTSLSTDNGTATFNATKDDLTLTRIFSIGKNFPAITPINVTLSMDNFSVSTDEYGNGGDYTGAVSEIIIMKGEYDVTDNWLITVNTSPGIVGSFVGSKYTVTDLTEDSGTVEFIASKDLQTFSKVFSIGKIKQAVSNTYIELSNDQTVITTDEFGNNGDYSIGSSTITIKKGSRDVTDNWLIDTETSIGIVGSYNNNTHTYSVTNMFTDNGEVVFTATDGDMLLTKKFTLSKSKQAVSNTVHKLMKEHNILLKDQFDVITPSSVKFTSTASTGNKDYTNYSAYFAIYERVKTALTIDEYNELLANNMILAHKEYIISSVENPYVLRYLSTVGETVVNYSLSSNDVLSIHCEIYKDINREVLLDNETVTVSSDGKDTYRLEVYSTNGEIFKQGDINSVLIATAYRGNIDITEETHASRFVWTRTSKDPLADDVWNNNHLAGAKSIEITKDDVYAKASFTCKLMTEFSSE